MKKIITFAYAAVAIVAVIVTVVFVKNNNEKVTGQNVSRSAEPSEASTTSQEDPVQTGKPGKVSLLDPTTSGPLTIETGTFFGECVGYCIGTITIDSKKIIYARRDSSGKLPEQSKEVAISAEAWSSLVGKLDKAKFNLLEETIGCPDCVDGGGEWLKITDASGSKTVTFEYGHDIPAIGEFLNEIRKIRSEAPEFNK